jgi:CheY-like chemotaxis protein
MSSPSLFPVMVVDDNVDDLFVLRQRLLRGGVENPILAFEDGEEAMAYLKRAMADPSVPLSRMMFLDLRMPRCGGFEVLKWVRAQPPLAEMRVVIVSTSSLPEDSARALQLGAMQFLQKYPSPETLAEIVKIAANGGGK